MPLYEYECKCGLQFEEFRSYEHRNSVVCQCGSREVSKLISRDLHDTNDSQYKDVFGTLIWFPKDGRPYFDIALRRTFNSIGEKQKYLKDNKLAMAGSDNPIRWPVEAGDNRSKAHRRAMRMED